MDLNLDIDVVRTIGAVFFLAGILLFWYGAKKAQAKKSQDKK
jgi:hypothetical protein